MSHKNLIPVKNSKRNDHLGTCPVSPSSSDTYSTISTSSTTVCPSPNRWCPPPTQWGCNPVPSVNNIYNFTSMVTPLNNLTTVNKSATVGFIMVRQGNRISLQWEPFSGNLAGNGESSLLVLQSITNLPQYLLVFPIYITFKGVGRLTTVTIDPTANNGNIRFYLNPDQSSTGVVSGDAVSIPSSSIEWTIE
jgi:hypothetical protein